MMTKAICVLVLLPFLAIYMVNCLIDEHAQERWLELDWGSYENEMCQTIYCHRGEECRVDRDSRVARCVCRNKCPLTFHPVCASDAKVYPNHCEMHRSSCLKELRLSIKESSFCPASEMARIDKLRSEHHAIELDHQKSNHFSDFQSDQPASKSLIPIAEFPDVKGLETDSPALFQGEKDFTETESLTNTELLRPLQENEPRLTSSLSSSTTVPPSKTGQTGNTPLRLSAKTAVLRHDQKITICAASQMKSLLDNLLLYFHVKYADSSDGKVTDDESDLTSMMFNKLDLNSNRILTLEELENFQKHHHLDMLEPKSCNFHDILRFLDSDMDSMLSEHEFLNGFGVPLAYVSTIKRVVFHQVKRGTQYQLLCSIKSTQKDPKVTWLRYGTSLANLPGNNFQTTKSGELYLLSADFVQTGNFSCRLAHHPSVEQVHVVEVFETLEVHVSPGFLMLTVGEPAVLHCDVTKGYPYPAITWLKNDKVYKKNVDVLSFAKVAYGDTGTYTCIAEGENRRQGAANASASVLVRGLYNNQQLVVAKALRPEENFAVFFDGGLRIFSAETCSLRHTISDAYPVSVADGSYLCQGKKCRWGSAVVTSPVNYVYAALPDQNAVVVVDVSRGSVHEILHLSGQPTQLWYTPWEDTVWVESAEKGEGGLRSLQVIRSATKGIRHSLSHALPSEDSFDFISSAFIPPHQAKYGHVAHSDRDGLEKFDLSDGHSVSSADLQQHNCHPVSIAYVLHNGFIAVECKNLTDNEGTGLLIMDYLSDMVLATHPAILGTPYWTPFDPNKLVMLQLKVGRVTVYQINGTELIYEHSLDEYLPLSDVTFQASPKGGAELLGTSPASDGIARMHLRSGKIDYPVKLDSVAGSGLDISAGQRQILPSAPGPGQHVIVAASDRVYCVDDAELTIHCETEALKHSQHLVWV